MLPLAGKTKSALLHLSHSLSLYLSPSHFLSLSVFNRNYFAISFELLFFFLLWVTLTRIPLHRFNQTTMQNWTITLYRTLFMMQWTVHLIFIKIFPLPLFLSPSVSVSLLHPKMNSWHTVIAAITKEIQLLWINF